VIVPAGIGFNKFITIAIVVAVLYFSREIFVPIALAGLLSFVLAPLVKMLQRWHLPRPLAVILTVAGGGCRHNLPRHNGDGAGQSACEVLYDCINNAVIAKQAG
jgi:AI-2E family transporter